MWIKRDFLSHWRPGQSLEALLLRGPRQIGKTAMLLKMEPPLGSQIYLDDPNERQRVKEDPEFVLSQLRYPILIDEIQRAPEILYSIKKRVDELRRKRIDTQQSITGATFRMTGSNQTEMDRSVQETLAGRISIQKVNGLSCHELWNFDESISLNEILFKGGFPELWVRRELNTISFINDYYSTFIEKDIAHSAGVEKTHEFSVVLKLLAARVGELLNYESIGGDAGVAGKSVKDWISLLEQNGIIYILRPYFSNLNKRLIKMPKAYFIDLGICTRMQGHQEPSSILSTPQAGHLFENAVISEAIKTKDNFRKDWDFFFWRTKEKEEIDLIIETNLKMILIQIKLGSFSSADFKAPTDLFKTGKEITRAIVTATGESQTLPSGTLIIPIRQLCDFLLEF
jgi:predicted AAA+ superfamily ATPase